MSLKKMRRSALSVPIQLKYAMCLTLVSGLLQLGLIFIMAWFIQRNYNLFTRDELGISSQVIEVIRKEQRVLEIGLFNTFLFSIIIMFGVSLVITRRLAGPMMAVQRHLQRLVEGDWSRDLRLRPNDEFQDVAELVNHLRQNQLKMTVAHPNPKAS